MIVNFESRVGQHPIEATQPSDWKKHQDPNAPALPTDIANGWPHGGFSGKRTRGNVEIPAFYDQIGEKRWGGGGRFLAGANSTHNQTPGTSEQANPDIVAVNGKANRQTFRSTLTMTPKSKRGPAMPIAGGGGTPGIDLDYVPPIVPTRAFDFGVVKQQEAPVCPESPGVTQAIAAGGSPKDIANSSVHSKLMTPAKSSGAGAVLRKVFQRPSRAGAPKMQVTQKIFNFRFGNVEQHKYIK